MAQGQDEETTWLTLGAASRLLGVSESTVRRWADAGEVRSYRTSGGHRRVRQEDLRLIIGGGKAGASDSDRISDLALARVKRQLSRGRQTPAFSSLDSLGDEARDRLRMLGRQLVDLFARYMTSRSKGERYVEDARTVGREYGRILAAEGIGLTAAVTAFNALRHSLEQTAWQNASESSLPPEDAVEALEAVLGLADIVLEGMAGMYEARQGQKGDDG